MTNCIHHLICHSHIICHLIYHVILPCTENGKLITHSSFINRHAIIKSENFKSWIYLRWWKLIWNAKNSWHHKHIFSYIFLNNQKFICMTNYNLSNKTHFWRTDIFSAGLKHLTPSKKAYKTLKLRCCGGPFLCVVHKRLWPLTLSGGLKYP